MAPWRVMVVALEPSGDVIAARAMRRLSALCREDGLRFAGVGGPRMRSAGLHESLFDMREGGVMGAGEVLAALPRLWLRLRQTAREVHRFDPHLLLTVDSKGFNLRLQRMVGARDGRRRVHIVPPSVWALRRRPWAEDEESLADLGDAVDEQLALLPFEPGLFASKCTFVGHAALEEILPAASFAEQPDAELKDGTGAPSSKLAPSDFAARNALPAWARLALPAVHERGPNARAVVGLFPGSRAAELDASLALIEEMREALAAKAGPFTLRVSAVDEAARRVLEDRLSGMAAWPGPWHVVCDKAAMFAGLDVAIATSGTVATELAARQVPTVVYYRGGRLTQWLARKLAKVRFVTLTNILADEEVVPEHVFEACRAQDISASAACLLADPQARAAQRSRHDALLPQLLRWDAASQLPVAPSVAIAHRLRAQLRASDKDRAQQDQLF